MNKVNPNPDYKDSDGGYLLINYFNNMEVVDLPITKKSMNAETIKLHKKAESLKPLLEKAGFKNLQYFWYADGFYRGNWKDMSVAIDRPEREQHDAYWEFGFKSVDENHFRVHLEAKVPIGEDYFRFDLKYYPDTELHDREGYLGPTAVLSVENILEEDLTNMQKYIDYLVK